MRHDVIIIGSGIVGLASALKILEQKSSVKLLLIEKEDRVALHQTGNNSGVIHSGIYYQPGSLRAKNCLDGYRMLLDFCDREGIAYEICGKIIVATEESELSRLQSIYERGIQNGLTGIKIINAEEIKEYEPHCAGIRGIYVPQTGIIDYTAVAEKYLEKILKLHGSIVYGEKVHSIVPESGYIRIATSQHQYESDIVINCAGLYSDQIAAITQKKLEVKILPFRGEYYTLRKEKEYLVKNLIYPVPDPNFPFLGVHFTRFIQGGVEAGPNAVLAYAREGYKKSTINFRELLDTITYEGFRNLARRYYKTGIEEFYRSYSKKAFTKALKRLVPELTEEDLLPGDAGVRASATRRDGSVVDDFMIERNGNIIHVLNSPSPAATASLAIGKYIADLTLNNGDSLYE